VKKILFLGLIILSIAACKKDGKTSEGDKSSKADKSAVTSADTASVDVDSTAPIKAISMIEGLPAGTKIVYVNLDTLQEKYQYFADENKANTARLKQLETQIVSKEKAIMATQSALQNRFQELQAKSQTMSPNDMKAAEIELQGKEQNLMKMQEDYQKFKESKQEELLKKQEQLNKKIKKRIDSYLEKVAEDNSLDFILSYSDMTNPILFGTKKLDITKQILKGLNEDYKSIKK
jgi:outer membrane protein